MNSRTCLMMIPGLAADRDAPANRVYPERRRLREYAVKPPRVQLAWVMVAIALIAINLGVLRENHFSDNHWDVSLMIQGVLPMGNALVIGLLISRHRPKSRPFLLGFGIVGAMASAFLSLAIFYKNTYMWIDWYAELGISLIEKTVTRDRTTLFVTLAYFAVMSMLGIPQLILAFLGGQFSCWVARSKQRAFFRANP
jgi:hypothetical protein